MAERRHALPGDEVSVLFTGRYNHYDAALGYHQIKGSYVDQHGHGHVPWTLNVHWSADLHVLDRYEEKLERPEGFPTTAEWIKALVKARQDAEAERDELRATVDRVEALPLDEAWIKATWLACTADGTSDAHEITRRIVHAVVGGVAADAKCAGNGVRTCGCFSGEGGGEASL